jgi:dephospho-CoA kinase
MTGAACICIRSFCCMPITPLIPAGERPVLDTGPSLWSLILWRWRMLGSYTVFAIAFGALNAWQGVSQWATFLFAGTLVCFWLARNLIDVLTRRYVITDVRVRAKRGAASRFVDELELSRVQQTSVQQGPLQRLFGVGDLFVSSAADVFPVTFASVSDPLSVQARLRESAASAVRASFSMANAGLSSPSPPHAPRPIESTSVPARQRSADEAFLVIGLVGGVGSGKSAVARALERRGFYVIDADQDAKAALDRDDVRRQLVEWWGQGVLTPEGRVHRAAVGDVVFKDPAQRLRLEGLIHPIILRDRDARIAQARSLGQVGVVLDAPLLFEAQSDRACDAVLFVDAPREVRLARVRATRGWSEDELSRRESAQMPLEQKRARSFAVIDNDGTLEALDHRVEEVLESVRQQAARKQMAVGGSMPKDHG